MQYLDMGSYGFYVWMAYGATALAIAIEIVSARRRLREAKRTDREEDDA